MLWHGTVSSSSLEKSNQDEIVIPNTYIYLGQTNVKRAEWGKGAEIRVTTECFPSRLIELRGLMHKQSLDINSKMGKAHLHIEQIITKESFIPA